MPVAITDDGGTFRCAITYRIGEFDAFEESLHLLIEGSASDNHLIHLASEGFQHFLADHLTHLLRDNGHLQQQAHAVVLNLREYLLADDLLNDEGHGNHDDRLDLGQCLCDNGGRRHTIEIVDMTTMQELEDELERHTVHMSHREHRDNLITSLDGLAQYIAGKIVVRPEGAIGNHHTFREARSTTRIIDDCQLVWTLLKVIIHMFLAEVFGEFLAIELIEVFAGVGQLVGTTDHQRIIGVVDDAFKRGHCHRVDNGGNMIAHKQQTCFRVIDNIMDLFGIELMQDGNGDSAVGECCQEGDSPLRRVAATEGNLVALLNTTVLEEDMYLLDLSGHIMEL